MSKKRTVKFSLDPNNLPPLSAKQKKALVELGRLPDSEIDYSDIPASTDEELALYKPVKKLTTVRIDADVLAWIRTYGKGYQTKINASLRQEMLAAKDK